MSVAEVHKGASPVILGFPHTGTFLPDDILGRLDANGRLLRDTDWHVERLYAGLLPDATTVRATFHRYVIDANRDPGGESLYPGQNTTGLVPITDFDGEQIWADGWLPHEAEIERRLYAYHAPYHAALAAEVARIKALHGIAVLYDCHSIRSQVPFLFAGRLPDLNIGTNGGKACDPRIETAVVEAAGEADGYTHVLNGRFKGGWTTRHYGKPEDGVHAIQMELAQSTHLASEAPPFAYDEEKAEKLRVTLGAILKRIEDLAYEMKDQSGERS